MVWVSHLNIFNFCRVKVFF